MIHSLQHIDFKKHSSIPILIILGLLTGIISAWGYGIFAFGIFLAIFMCLTSEKAEKIFFVWLLLSPLFTIDALSFLTVHNHPILTFNRVVIGALFVIILLEVFTRRRNLLPGNKLELAMIVFLMVIIYSILSAPIEKLTGARKLIDGFVYPFMIYFLSKNIITDLKRFNKFITLLVIMGFYLSLMGIYEGLTGNDVFPNAEGLVERSGWLRINGPYKTDTAFGVILSFCFLITFYRYVTYTKNHIRMNANRIFYLVVLGLSLIALFLNFYRGIWLAVIAGLLTWFFIRRRGLSKLGFWIIVLSLILIPSYSVYKSTSLFEERISHFKSVESRFNYYSNAMELFKKNPLTGGGFSYYSYRGSTHNTFLSFLSETGILGFGMFLVLIGLIFYRGFKNYKLSDDYIYKEFSIIFTSLFIMFMVTGLTQDTGFESEINLMFYAFVGVLPINQGKYKLEAYLPKGNPQNL